jgi:hypothetical protein
MVQLNNSTMHRHTKSEDAYTRDSRLRLAYGKLYDIKEQTAYGCIVKKAKHSTIEYIRCKRDSSASKAVHNRGIIIFPKCIVV